MERVICGGFVVLSRKIQNGLDVPFDRARLISKKGKPFWLCRDSELARNNIKALNISTSMCELSLCQQRKDRVKHLKILAACTVQDKVP